MDLPLESCTAAHLGIVLLLLAAALLWRSSAAQLRMPALIESGPWWKPAGWEHTLYLLTPLPPAEMRADYKRFGGASRLRTILAPLVMVTGPEVLRWAFRSDAALKMELPPHWRRLIGVHNIAYKAGAEHTRLRATLAVAFTPAALAAAMPMIQRMTRGFLADLATRAPARGPTVDAFPAVKRFTLDIACAIMLGAMPDEDPRLGALRGDFAVWLEGLATHVPINLPFTPFGRSSGASYLRLLMEERRRGAGVATNTDTPGRLMSARTADGSALTDVKILDAVLGFLVAGSDTSAATICSAFHALTKQAPPDTVARLRAEIAPAFPDAGPPSNTLNSPPSLTPTPSPRNSCACTAPSALASVK